MRIAGRREWEIALSVAVVAAVFVFVPVRVDVECREKRARSSMKFPAARLEGVRGSSSFTVTSYGWSETKSVPTEAVPHGWPSLSRKAS